jgi:23S rRNA (adenine2503-C2)-methyltransferase
MINLKALSKEEICRFTEERQLPGYRAEQLLHWIYERYAGDMDEITEFSKELRHDLKKIAYISNLSLKERLQSQDGTEKFLFSLEDSQTIESVLIPDEDRHTLCISSQVGCAMGCIFCLTGKGGFIRNLQAYEIADQIISVNRLIQPQKVTNVVFMGMGEPLLNFDNVVEALWRITGFIGISKRKITLSTSGIVPKILLLPQKAPAVNLAVSLNAASDAVRNRLMPVNKKYHMQSVIDACRSYPLRHGRRITFEYVLIEGENDSTEDAKRLVKLLKGLRCKINLIPLNPHEWSGLKSPSNDRILEFQKILLKKNLRALIRESKGQDILAACGQLRSRSEPVSS